MPRKACTCRTQSRDEPTLEQMILDDLHGAGFFDTIKNFFSKRDDYNNTSRKTLDEFGNDPIISITLSRAPITFMMGKAFDVVSNVFSFGKFKKLMQEEGFDKFYHLAMLVDVMHNGQTRKIAVEKNQTINISAAYKLEKDAEYFPIDLKGKTITLRELLDTTQKRMGKNDFFMYSAFGNNCQNFIDNILRANGIWSDGAHKWLFQELGELARKLPSFTRNMLQGLTDVGAWFDKILGRGLPTEEEYNRKPHKLSYQEFLALREQITRDREKAQRYAKATQPAMNEFLNELNASNKAVSEYYKQNPDDEPVVCNVLENLELGKERGVTKGECKKRHYARDTKKRQNDPFYHIMKGIVQGTDAVIGLAPGQLRDSWNTISSEPEVAAYRGGRKKKTK